jgi:meiotic recombination protein SPO11
LIYDCSSSVFSISDDLSENIAAISPARFILVVEKEAVFQRIHQSNIPNILNCILITGQGYPPIGVRKLLQRLIKLLNIPAFGLFDFNPHGADILLTYMFGSVRMGTESYNYSCNSIRWIGIHWNDVQNISNLSEFNETDHRVLKKIENHPFILQSSLLKAQISYMRIYHKKADIEALDSIRLNYLTDTFIREKCIQVMPRLSLRL